MKSWDWKNIVGGFIHHASYNTNFDTYYIVQQDTSIGHRLYFTNDRGVVSCIHNSQQKCNCIRNDELNIVLTKLHCISIFIRGGISVEICVS